MATRQAWHQFDPVKIRRAEFEKLPFREDVKGEAYKDGARYRSRSYPDDVFVWEAFERGAKTKGEWQMGAAEID